MKEVGGGRGGRGADMYGIFPYVHNVGRLKRKGKAHTVKK
jgi:hypothetical protein